MPLDNGTVLENRYRIDSLLAQGGMGAIYRAFDTKLDISIAIKENFFSSQESIRQFRQEALILARLHHPGLPRVTDHFSFEEHQYLVMDFIEGQDLWQKIKELDRPLEEREALNYIIQVCEAVSYLHRQKPPIIHRDIKPQNIKVRPDDWPMLVDFGIAKSGDDSQTSTGAKGVTPGFSPPEQYSGGGTGISSDIYALGATLYTLLTGQKPPDSVSMLVNRVQFVSPLEINPRLDERVSAAITHAMQLKAANRPASVQAWQRELENVKKTLPALQVRGMPTLPSIVANRAELFKQREAPSESSGTPPQLPARLEVELEPESQARLIMVLIPAGEFFMGSVPQKDRRAQETELPRHRLHLPDYYIAETAITQAQYALFIQATEYTPPAQKGPAQYRWVDGKPPPDSEAYPVVLVNWYDANAYCRWLSEMTGQLYRLPTEAEWEKAARGPNELVYPWGNRWSARRCNSRESGKGGPTPVDEYPDGASPYEVLDMAGNVWEWTLSLYKPYPYQASDGRENYEGHPLDSRVLRGGSWDYSGRRYARCAGRWRNPPYISNTSIGFRVMTTPA